MRKLIEYLAVSAMGLAFAFWLATTVSAEISNSLNASADLIEHPERAGR
jgi:hypothetical protein